MLRHVMGDLYQIGESVAGRDGWHEAVRVYVLMNDGCPLLFDTGSHIHSGRIMAELRDLLGDTAPAHVFLTHTELPTRATSKPSSTPGRTSNWSVQAPFCPMSNCHGG